MRNKNSVVQNADLSIEQAYDQALRIEALIKAAGVMIWQMDEVHHRDNPASGVVEIIDMAKNETVALAELISKLENQTKRAA